MEFYSDFSPWIIPDVFGGEGIHQQEATIVSSWNKKKTLVTAKGPIWFVSLSSRRSRECFDMYEPCDVIDTMEVKEYLFSSALSSFFRELLQWKNGEIGGGKSEESVRVL